MTKSQEKALEFLKCSVDAWCQDHYEIKHWDVENCRYFVSVSVETGLPKDEGTYAQYFARDHALIFIGPRGRIYYLKNKDGKFVDRKYTTFIDAVVNQRV